MHLKPKCLFICGKLLKGLGPSTKVINRSKAHAIILEARSKAEKLGVSNVPHKLGHISSFNMMIVPW